MQPGVTLTPLSRTLPTLQLFAHDSLVQRFTCLSGAGPLQEEEFIIECAEAWRVGPEPEREEGPAQPSALANVCAQSFKGILVRLCCLP